ncbi:MAG: peroxiredoxin [Alphaproteobacteria bacterium]|nr:MAG: peroxiredoxin [Alphaproteobacteria bacterium]
MTNINDKIESFELDTDQGKFYSKDHVGKNLVLFFFPKADTTGCTKEAISFSNLINEFEDLNTIVIGISKDTVEKQIKFKSKYDLKCILGSDVDIKICSKFGVWVEKSMYGKKYMGIQRSTFLINTEQKIQHIWNKVKVPGHAEEVLEVVKKL